MSLVSLVISSASSAFLPSASPSILMAIIVSPIELPLPPVLFAKSTSNSTTSKGILNVLCTASLGNVFP